MFKKSKFAKRFPHQTFLLHDSHTWNLGRLKCTTLSLAIISILIVSHHCLRQFWRAVSKLIIWLKVTFTEIFGRNVHYSDSEMHLKKSFNLYKYTLPWHINWHNAQWIITSHPSLILLHMGMGNKQYTYDELNLI